MIQASGLASGVDTKAIVQQLVNLERQPLRRLAAKKQTYSRQISRLGNFASRLSEFQTQIAEFASSKTLLSTQSSSSDEDAVRVRSTGAARTGSWEVEVHQTARAERSRSAAFSDASALVKQGTLTLDVWGEDAVEVTIGEDMTLDQVRDLINDSGAEVEASILNVDSGSYLSITSTKTGHDGGPALTLTESYGSGLPGFPTAGSELQLTTHEAAQNAQVTIDGEMVTSHTNTIEEAIEGVTLDLRGESASPIDVSVTQDEGEVTEKTQALISSYNALYREANAIKEEDHRFGTSAARALREAMTFGVDGSSVPNLSALGITTSKDTGELVFNASAFEEGLRERPSGIVDLFGKEGSGIVDRIDRLVDRYTDSVDGMVETNKKMWQERITRADETIERGERRIDAYELRLKSQFSAMEQIISSLTDTSNRFASMLPPVPSSRPSQG